MDSDKLSTLLDKYWNGQTSLEEEQELHRYFRESPVPDQLKETASLFHYFDQSKKKHLNDTFDTEVLRKIKGPEKGKTATLVFNWMRIAAGIIVLVLAVWLVRMEVRKSTAQEIPDTYDDPKIAFEETKKALLMISKSFGTAEEQAKKINLFNEAQEDIRKEESNTDL